MENIRVIAWHCSFETFVFACLPVIYSRILNSRFENGFPNRTCLEWNKRLCIK